MFQYRITNRTQCLKGPFGKNVDTLLVPMGRGHQLAVGIEGKFQYFRILLSNRYYIKAYRHGKLEQGLLYGIALPVLFPAMGIVAQDTAQPQLFKGTVFFFGPKTIRYPLSDLP